MAMERTSRIATMDLATGHIGRGLGTDTRTSRGLALGTATGTSRGGRANGMDDHHCGEVLDQCPGGGRIEACLRANLSQLSAPCVDVMARTVGRVVRTLGSGR